MNDCDCCHPNLASIMMQGTPKIKSLEATQKETNETNTEV